MQDLRNLPEDIPLELRSKAAKAQVRDIGRQEGATANECAGPVRQVGETEEECGQRAGGPGEAQ